MVIQQALMYGLITGKVHPFQFRPILPAVFKSSLKTCHCYMFIPVSDKDITFQLLLSVRRSFQLLILNRKRRYSADINHHLRKKECNSI